MPARTVTLPEKARNNMSDQAKEKLPEHVDIAPNIIRSGPEDENFTGTSGVDYFIFDAQKDNGFDTITNFDPINDRIIVTNAPVSEPLGSGLGVINILYSTLGADITTITIDYDHATGEPIEVDLLVKDYHQNVLSVIHATNVFPGDFVV
jgi:Ca2+-binding RTX toxin-like protein